MDTPANKIINLEINKNEITKKTIEDLTNEITKLCYDNTNSIVDYDIMLKCLQTAIEQSRQNIKKDVEKHIYNNNLKEHKSVKITIRKGYDVPDLESDEEYKILKEKLKEREALLKKAFESENLMIVTEDGEMIKKPKIKYTTENTISYSFK